MATTQIGKYRILDTLGKGAMGVVYKAFDQGVERIVALKVIHPHLLASEGADATALRFRREAQAAGRLLHPNIVSLFEYGEDEARPYIAMEFVEGVDLKTLMQRGTAFSMAQTVSMVSQLLNALQYAHLQGVIHRDIKPANLLLQENGQIKVMDFGIARVESSDLTQAGAVMGSPGYMSPEQVRGLRVDGRSDLFSAGVLLFELLTGQRLYSGQERAAILQQILTEPPPAPSSQQPGLSAALDQVVGKALAKEPDHRFQTAAQFKNAVAMAHRGAQLDIADSFPGGENRVALEPPPTLVADAPATLVGATTVLRQGRIFLPVPVEELPPGKAGVDLYLVFHGNYVLFRRRGLPLEESVLDQWRESGIERVFLPEEQLSDYLKWIHRLEKGSPGAAHPALLYLQDHFFQVDPRVILAGVSLGFPLFASEGDRIFPIVGEEMPGLPTAPDQALLARHPRLHVHVRDLPGYLDHLNRLMGREARFSPLNRKGAVLVREKMKSTAHALFHAPKAGEALSRARGMVETTLDLIAGNPDTYYAMIAIADLDAATYIHSTNVSVLSMGLGVAMGLPRERILHLGLGGLLHDIGKRELPMELLFRGGTLSAQEYESLKEHVLLGVRFCRDHDIPEPVIRIVAQHHEKLDGSGYPAGFTARELDELSQVVAILEIYDALTSRQPFRKALTPFLALKKLREMGKKLNQGLITLFIQHLGAQARLEE